MDDLLPQAEFMLNILRPTRINPNISAYTYLFGAHNYNAVPWCLLAGRSFAWMIQQSAKPGHCMALKASM